MRRATLLSAATVILFLQAAPAPAQSNFRSWVASNGSGSSCTRALPCASFQVAHDATVSTGEINCVDAGDYGSLVIAKAINIVCDNTQAVITVVTTGILINAGSNDTVTLIGLDIDTLAVNPTAGIVFQSGAALHLNKVRIRNMIRGSGGDVGALYFQPNAYAELYITDSIITGNGGAGALSGGIIITPGASASVNAAISRVRLENNSTGIIVDGTRSTGVAVNATIVDSVVAGSQSHGILVQSGTAAAFAFIDHSVASGNFGSAVRVVGSSATARIGDSTINLNVTGVSTASGGTVQSFQNNRISGNLNNGTPLPAVALQ